MNRLWIRLTLSFVAVTLVAVLVVAVLADWSTDRQFRHYVEQRETAGMTTPGRSMMGRGMPMMMQADQDFLNQLRGTLVIAAVVAGGIGVLLGVIISRTIAAPLANLANAAHDFAAHRWERRVPVEGATEIGEVAHAFNAMADELQRAETLRRNLMADIAHELRTPLTVMQGSLRALLDGVYPLKLKEIASLYDETRLLNRLVTDLRELALAEAGQLPLNMQSLELVPILQQVTNQFSAAVEAQNTRVILESSPIQVCADADRLTQVLHNLLANALHHTSDGTITVSTETISEFARVKVQDTGSGIEPEDLPHVFDRFYRADDARSRTTGGAGLGLAIAKAWVEAMGGQIGVESTPGQGSTFWFTLCRAA
jgi:two-component system OmpR family sensor kinase/two-component system sensor histidine kinase BaeS